MYVKTKTFLSRVNMDIFCHITKQNIMIQSVLILNDTKKKKKTKRNTELKRPYNICMNTFCKQNKIQLFYFFNIFFYFLFITFRLLGSTGYPFGIRVQLFDVQVTTSVGVNPNYMAGFWKLASEKLKTRIKA